MTRNLKVLGLALVAIFALSAVAANAAFGAEEFFHSHKENTILTGEATNAQEFKLGPTLPAVVCGKGKFAGTETGTKHEGGAFGTTWTTTSVTVHPEYSECTFSTHPATTNTHNCHYKLFAETTETTTGKPMGNVEVAECPSGATIDIEVPALGVTIHVANQTLLHGISYTNNKPANTEEWSETVNATVGTEGPSKIAWTCTPKATCTSGLGTNEGKEGTYIGSTLVKGFSDLEKTATGTYKESTQTGIWKGPAE